MFLIGLAYGDVAISDLSDNPGVYPQHMGNALIQENLWTLIQIVDYEDVINNYELLVSHIYTLINEVELTKNDPSFNTILPFHNLLIMIEEYIRKLNQIKQQIFPDISIRSKRGLVDGFGTIIKFLTGNLDSQDGKRYEETITKLSDKANLNSKILLEHTHIINETLNDILALSTNQQTLIVHIDEILTISENIKNRFTIDNIKILLIETLFSLQLFFNNWSELENALTFSQKQQMHLSLLENENLLENLNFIQTFLSQNQDNSLELPFPIKSESLHLYESIIITKAYQIKNRITFIFQIPLVKKNQNYEIIELIPFPIYLDENLYRMIIPTYSMLLFSNSESIPINIDRCQLITPNQYFCNQKDHFYIPNDKICETQLLSFSKNQSCKPYLFDLIDLKITQADISTWLITTPDKILLEINCKDQNYKKLLEKSNSIHLSTDCTVLINHKTLLFSMRVISNKNEIMKVPSINKLSTNHSNSNSNKIKPLDLLPINTKNIINNQALLQNEQSLLESDNVVKQTYSIISIAALVLASIVTIVVVILSLLCYCKKPFLINKLNTLIKNKNNESNQLAEAKF